jgi:hypothetical protein
MCDQFFLGQFALKRDRADVDLDRLRGFFTGNWLHGLAEHIELCELERFPPIARILVLQPVFPLLSITRVLKK